MEKLKVEERLVQLGRPANILELLKAKNTFL